MNKEQDYASDTDESDEEFRLEDVVGESAGSEDDGDDNESNEGSNDETEELKQISGKSKGCNKRINRKKKLKHADESEEEKTLTSRRSTRHQNCETNGKTNNLEKDELSDDEDESHTNALWADFLKDVDSKDSVSRVNKSKIENNPSSSGFVNKDDKEKKDEVKIDIILSPKVKENKRAVTEVVDFAGEEVRLEHELDAYNVKENKATVIPTPRKQPFGRIMPGAGIKRLVPSSASGSAAGLGSVLNQLGKKKKLSVLEKSQMDWKCFKQSEGIDEQIQTFNRGKDGYLERQDFLQRTDLRQFEIEKNLRKTSRRPY